MKRSEQYFVISTFGLLAVGFMGVARHLVAHCDWDEAGGKVRKPPQIRKPGVGPVFHAPVRLTV